MLKKSVLFALDGPRLVFESVGRCKFGHPRDRKGKGYRRMLSTVAPDAKLQKLTPAVASIADRIMCPPEIFHTFGKGLKT